MTPAEEVELRAKQAGIDAQYVTAQALTPEAVASNRVRADGWSPETRIDLAARKALLDETTADDWSGVRWKGVRWKGVIWDGVRWKGADWTSGQWTAGGWSGVRWRGVMWSDAAWS